MKVVFIQTGGTIDKDYPKTDRGYAFEFGEPAVERILQRVNPCFDFEVVSVLEKDSLDITSEDRERIYEACRKARSSKIVITHGTDTMIETARKLSKIRGKAIILTGAMRPEKFSDSDASFNVGTAIGAINVLEEGVYIAMNGLVYRWDRVQRDKETGQFTES
jgi:L-asparaginase